MAARAVIRIIEAAARSALVFLCFCGMPVGEAGAWENHSLPAYRAFERMPEIAAAPPVQAEALDAFLKAEEKAVAQLLAGQEVWARANIDAYPPRPSALDFRPEAGAPDAARRMAFFRALRIAQDSRFALYLQPDGQEAVPQRRALPFAAASSLPQPAGFFPRFVALAPGERVPALEVVASATDEPDYGLDINCWQDSPGEWGKTYGFGPLPFGNPALAFATQAPFHMGFFHESSVIYQAAPFLRRTFPLLRAHQYSTLAVLAFRTGHAYWGWRFTGLALHYVQDLTQPYHASLAPGESAVGLITANILALAGLPAMKRNLTVLLSNRHLALERYQLQLLQSAAQARLDSPVVLALRSDVRDASYPAWSDAYLRDVVARQAHAHGPGLAALLMATMPKGYVADPDYDFGVQGDRVDLLAELSHRDPARRAELDHEVADLMGNFGAHTRNFVRAILKAAGLP